MAMAATNLGLTFGKRIAGIAGMWPHVHGVKIAAKVERACVGPLARIIEISSS